MWECIPYILVVAGLVLRTCVLFMRYFCGLLLVSSFAPINSKWESDELVIATLISLGSVFICFCFAGIHFKWKPFPQCRLHQFISVWTLMLHAHHNLNPPVSVSLLVGGCCEMVLWFCSNKVIKCQKLWKCQVFAHLWSAICICADGNYSAAVWIVF